MSKIYRGTINFGGQFLPTAGQPLDDRLVVNQFSDLIAPTTFKVDEEPDGDRTWYVGMIVSVLSDNAVYMLIGPDPTVSENWKKVNPDLDISGEMINVVEYNNEFYDKRDGSGEPWTPNPGAEPIDDPQVNEEGKYLCLQLNETDTVYIKSTDLISLDNYYTKDEINNKLVDLSTNLKEYIDEQDESIKSYVDTSLINLRDYVETVEQRITDVSTALYDYIDATSEKIDQLDSSISSIETNINNINETLGDLIERHDREVEEINNHLDNIDSSINNLKIEDVSLETAIEDVSQRLADLEVGTVDSISTDTPEYLLIDTSKGDVTINIDTSISTDSEKFPNTALVTNGYLEEKMAWVEVEDA